jgi:hypothetical protein
MTSVPMDTSTQTAISAETATPTPAGWNYLGCYNDLGNLNGARPLSVKLYTDLSMTPGRCQTACGEAGYEFAGLEYGKECWCDHRMNGTPTLAGSESQCNMACTGDSSLKCGASDRLAVYHYQDPVDNGWLPMPGEGSCYSDNNRAGLPALSYPAPATWASSMTNRLCQAYCQGLNYELAGTQYSKQCWCGNSVQNGHKAVSASGCNMACTGEASQMCGGSDRFTMYYSKWKSVGCRVDSRFNRVFDPYTGPAPRHWKYIGLSDQKMTIPMCQAHCESMGYSWAGLQYSAQCFCGHTPNYQTIAANSSCNMPCAGDTSTTCGGSDRIWLYQLTDRRS